MLDPISGALFLLGWALFFGGIFYAIVDGFRCLRRLDAGSAAKRAAAAAAAEPAGMNPPAPV